MNEPLPVNEELRPASESSPFFAAFNTLNKDLMAMAHQVQEQLSNAVTALKDRNQPLAQLVLDREREVNQFENRIDAAGIEALARYQPLASNLRLVVMALKIGSDLERIGDHAVNIAQRALYLSGQPQLKPLIDIPLMAERAGEMLQNAVDAFGRRDTSASRAVLKEDNYIDELRSQIFRELLTYIAADLSTIDRAMQLILVAKDLERVADLATNIAEDVIYLVEGETVKHTVPKSGPPA
ncbi:MAG TPA: phosphate signaling complex protein PhoU [Thermoanaerobaculia bacterium]